METERGGGWAEVEEQFGGDRGAGKAVEKAVAKVSYSRIPGCDPGGTQNTGKRGADNELA